MAKNNVMTHLIAGYPSMEESRKIALAMIAGGSAYLEVQFPFSDPIADGPLIQGACTEAINNGFTQEQGFSLISELSKESDIPVFIMTYANLVMAAGVESFVKKSRKAGAAGLIIPDLPFDYDDGLYEICKKENITVIPVIVQGISKERLEKILALNLEYLYAAIRKGITGQKSAIDSETIDFLNKISQSGSKVLAGFGIREREQVDLLVLHSHCAVIGSALVNNIKNSIERKSNIAENVKNFVSTLCQDKI
ncbi:MAG: tryptophan synthase subunit alpha [Spirochaetaceae bacterium]|jgi:tryptophan synthase alpha chain|nr:tryptophan synthase subunit alpha [Spirochaetaceae bacterium]